MFLTVGLVRKTDSDVSYCGTGEKDRQRCFWCERQTVVLLTVWLVREKDSGVPFCGSGERDRQWRSLPWDCCERQKAAFLTVGLMTATGSGVPHRRPVRETHSCVPYRGSC